jgi:hypothetical protein
MAEAVLGFEQQTGGDLVIRGIDRTIDQAVLLSQQIGGDVKSGWQTVAENLGKTRQDFSRWCCQHPQEVVQQLIAFVNKESPAKDKEQEALSVAMCQQLCNQGAQGGAVLPLAVVTDLWARAADIEPRLAERVVRASSDSPRVAPLIHLAEHKTVPSSGGPKRKGPGFFDRFKNLPAWQKTGTVVVTIALLGGLSYELFVPDQIKKGVSEIANRGKRKTEQVVDNKQTEIGAGLAVAVMGEKAAPVASRVVKDRAVAKEAAMSTPDPKSTIFPTPIPVEKAIEQFEQARMVALIKDGSVKVNEVVKRFLVAGANRGVILNVNNWNEDIKKLVKTIERSMNGVATTDNLSDTVLSRAANQKKDPSGCLVLQMIMMSADYNKPLGTSPEIKRWLNQKIREEEYRGSVQELKNSGLDWDGKSEVDPVVFLKAYYKLISGADWEKDLPESKAIDDLVFGLTAVYSSEGGAPLSWIDYAVTAVWMVDIDDDRILLPGVDPTTLIKTAAMDFRKIQERQWIREKAKNKEFYISRINRPRSGSV